MDWQLVHLVSHNPVITNPFKTNFSFKSKELIIEAVLIVPPGLEKNWYRAGYVSPVFSFIETGLVNGRKQEIALKRQHLKITESSFPYQLEIYLHEWISQISLRFWEPIYTPVILPNPGEENDVKFVVIIDG